MKHKQARTAVPIHELLATRWSGRAYDPDAPVEADDILSLMEAARWAPSCYGDQPWRFLILNRFDDADQWQLAFDTLDDWNQSWAKYAPVLVVVVASTQFSAKNNKENRWAEYDTGAAAENFCLQATALELITRQIGGFDQNRMRDAFEIPPEFTPMAVIAVGHPGPSEHLEERHAAAEVAPRSRNPLEEHFFVNKWGQGTNCSQK